MASARRTQRAGGRARDAPGGGARCWGGVCPGKDAGGQSGGAELGGSDQVRANGGASWLAPVRSSEVQLCLECCADDIRAVRGRGFSTGARRRRSGCATGARPHVCSRAGGRAACRQGRAVASQHARAPGWGRRAVDASAAGSTQQAAGAEGHRTPLAQRGVGRALGGGLPRDGTHRARGRGRRYTMLREARAAGAGRRREVK